MIIEKSAVAGTLESSDCLVSIEPSENGIELEIESVVLEQYGDQIKKTVMETLKELNVDSASVHINDRGALDCVISARVEAAVIRSNNKGEQG